MAGMINAIILVLLLSFACPVSAPAASLDELSPYLSLQQYRWEEFGEGRRLLEESGQLIAGGVVVGAKTGQSLTLRGRFELFGGSVEYDGETQGGDPIPVETDVNYFGMKNQFDLGYRISRPTVSIEPFAGVAHRWWLRDLEDSYSSTGVAVSGYTEVWQTGYARVGARGRYHPPAPVSLFVEAGALYPFYTGNRVDFEGYGDTTFRPDGRVSAFGEAGAQWRELKLSLHYEGFRWSESPVKAVGSQFFFQPRSEADIFGLSIGWAFR